jgi:hypothetical protein
MLAATVALVLLSAGPSPGTPDSWVAALGSPRYAVREQADAALTRLGRAALSALRAASSSSDAEVRVRALAILARIEGSLLAEATPVELDARDRPLGDVLRELHERTGVELASDFAPDLLARRVTLAAPGPLPFWKAIDELCSVAHLRYAPDSTGFRLREGATPVALPVSDSGPFRSRVTSLHYQSEIQLGTASADDLAPGDAIPARQFYLQLLVAAEPRLALVQDGPIRRLEAVDEHGQSLTLGGGSRTTLRSAGYLGVNASAALRLRVDLAYPESPSRRIRLLKGAVPVVISARTGDPVVIRLTDGPGTVARNGQVVLGLREVRPATDDRPASIEVSLASVDGASPPVGVGSDTEPESPSRPGSPRQQVEVLDAQGQSLPWFLAAQRYEGAETRLTLSLVPQSRPAEPVAVRFHRVTRVATDVPFEFRDLPMP